MGRFKVSIILICFLLFPDVPVQATHHFPLNDCDTEQFDILLMDTWTYHLTSWNPHIMSLITDAWVTDEDTSRVRISSVNVPLSANKDTFNVDMKMFDGSYVDIRPKLTNLTSDDFSNQSLHTNIELKVNIAAYIFSVMGIGRKNSTHVAIIFIRVNHFVNSEFKNYEAMCIPIYLEPYKLKMKVTYKLEMKVIIILEGNLELPKPIFDKDILLINYKQMVYVPLALCRHCPSSWHQFNSETSGSCYKLFEAVKISWAGASKICEQNGGNLVAVESEEELDSLRDMLSSYFINNDMMTMHREVENVYMRVYIGLKRGSEDVVKSFQWVHPEGPRPLVINHWLPGNPAGGPCQAYGIWTFKGIINVSQHLDTFTGKASVGRQTPNTSRTVIESEGWSSTGCGSPLGNRILCEASLPINNQDYYSGIRPPHLSSYFRVLNMTDFHKYDGQLVSVSAYASKEYSYLFTEKKFPLFDCGEDASYPRYISYSYVCDYIKHCENNRDETMCFIDHCNTCHSGQCIPETAKCDNFKDCADGSDEENCKECTGRYNCDGTCLPEYLFHEGEIDCWECQKTKIVSYKEVHHYEEHQYIDDIYYPDRFKRSSWYTPKRYLRIDTTVILEPLEESCALFCNRGDCISLKKLNDGKFDCNGPEGHLDETLGKLERADNCLDKLNQSLWAPKCVYVKDRYGSILGCKDLSHLQNCSDFQCQEGYYKCPGRYCIPIHHVMDGKNDCPSGEEERHVSNHKCMRNFACWGSDVCLHPDLVCDGHPDCPHKDDELNCNVFCPDGLRCIAGTVTVDDKSMNDFVDFLSIDSRTRYLDLSGVDLSLLADIDFTEERLYFFDVNLSKCNISSFHESFNYKWRNVKALDLSYNLLSHVQHEVFQNVIFLNLSFNENITECSHLKLGRLEVLDLSHTGLVNLGDNCFSSLPKLKHLNLSNTRLSTLTKINFPASFTLQTLDLRGAPIVKYSENSFNDLIISSSLYTDNFGLCCSQVRGSGIPAHTCHASADAISSCDDLLAFGFQRVLLWLMAIIALLGNLVVILYRLIWDKSVLKLAYGLFVLNLGISDMIMGLYLLVIAGADIFYRDVYVLYDKNWREGIVCKMAGFLATLSSETSIFFILLITIDRFLVLKFPFGEWRFSRTTKVITIALAWIIGFILALITVLPVFGTNSVFTSNAMCVGLPLTSQRIDGWGYSLGIFIVLNFVMFLFIALGQLAIFRSMSGNRMSKETSNQNSLRRAQDIIVAKQLSLVVLSDFLCWFPVGLMGFLSLSGHEITKDSFAWAVILVLPVNSAINPIIYTIPVVVDKWERFKHGDSTKSPQR